MEQLENYRPLWETVKTRNKNTQQQSGKSIPEYTKYLGKRLNLVVIHVHAPPKQKMARKLTAWRHMRTQYTREMYKHIIFTCLMCLIQKLSPISTPWICAEKTTPTHLVHLWSKKISTVKKLTPPNSDRVCGCSRKLWSSKLSDSFKRARQAMFLIQDSLLINAFIRYAQTYW